MVKGPSCPSDGYQAALVFLVTRSQRSGFSAYLHLARWKHQTHPMLPVASSFVVKPRGVLPRPYLLNISQSWCFYCELNWVYRRLIRHLPIFISLTSTRLFPHTSPSQTTESQTLLATSYSSSLLGQWSMAELGGILAFPFFLSS